MQRAGGLRQQIAMHDVIFRNAGHARRPLTQGLPKIGLDKFLPVDGHNFLRFCYAGSAAEMHEAVERIGKWLAKR